MTKMKSSALAWEPVSKDVTTVMKKILFCALVALAVSFGAQPSLAQTTATPPTIPLVIAVMDIELILRESSAGKAILADLQQQRDRIQAELTQREQALREQDQQLAATRATLSAEDFAAKKSALDNDMRALQQSAIDRGRALDDAVNAARAEVKKGIAQILAQLAQQRGYTLVINKSSVLLSANGFDITQEVMNSLNQTLPSVAVTKVP